MNIAHTSVLFGLLVFPLCSSSGLEVPAELEQLMASPPSISESVDPSKRGSFSVPEAKGALIEGKGFIAYVTLQNDPDGKTTKYHFRAYSKLFKVEVEGDGELYEHYYRVSDPAAERRSVRVFDKGSKLTIDAGLFKADWSGERYIYFDPDRFSITPATEADYESKIKNG